MKRLSRHTVVVIVVALLSCVGGMSLAVVAFGQSTGNPDAGVPAGDFTGTTPAPTSGYTSTVPTTTTPLSTYTSTTPTTTTPAQTTPTETTTGQSGSGHKDVGSGGSSSGGSPTPSVPSRATRPGPTHLAFTGGEPLLIGGAGVALMLGGLTLQARRRRAQAR
jgi:hypothetical protein